MKNKLPYEEPKYLFNIIPPTDIICTSFGTDIDNDIGKDEGENNGEWIPNLFRNHITSNTLKF